MEDVHGAFRRVVWYDDDDSGRSARRRATAKVTERYGEDWARERLRHVHTPPGKDANALHVEGRLASIIQAAAWMAAPPAPPAQE
jgi:hypothetical protein